MRKRDVREQQLPGTPLSPLVVIAHARWARARRRQPSMSYGTHHNPRLALRQALDDIGATLADLSKVDLRYAELPLPSSCARVTADDPSAEWFDDAVSVNYGARNELLLWPAGRYLDPVTSA